MTSLHKSELQKEQMMVDKRLITSPASGRVFCHLSKISLLLEDIRSWY